MKIKAISLIQPLKITISGDEPWLLPIYETFATGPTQARLSGSLEVVRESSGFVHVGGRIRVTPYVECSRCADPIPWPIDEVVDATFRPERTNHVRTEHAVSTGNRRRGKKSDDFEDDFEDDDSTAAQRDVKLTRADLDEYTMRGGEIDLAELVNDTVQLAIPLQTVRSDPTGSACSICGIDLTSDLVYGSPDHDNKLELPSGSGPESGDGKGERRKKDKKSGQERTVRGGNLPEHLH